jgi:hypothetical protein
VAGIADIEADMANGSDVRFADLLKVCTHYFGKHRTVGSHHVFKTKWQGKPYVNIQKDGNKAKAYQIKQVLEAIAKLKEMTP